ncbi:MAG TPA: hypothetical protein VGK13_08125 [Methanocellaceae archaeon]
MLTIGELVICCAILTIAFLAMLVVFIKNAVEQNTDVPNLLLSVFKIRKNRVMVRKIAKIEKDDVADERLKTGEMEEGHEMASKDTTRKIETGAKAKKGTSGFLTDLASTMFLWQPSKLLGGRKEKFAEQSKEIDSELDKLLAENMSDEAAPGRQEVQERSRQEIPGDDPEKARAAIESRLKGLFKDDRAAEQRDEEKKEPVALDNDITAASIKVEKLEIPEGVTPKWDAIIPHKDPAMIAQDAVILESKILKSDPADETSLNATEAPKVETNMRLKINDMPVWGRTELGKPLSDFKSVKGNDPAPGNSELSASQLQDKNEVEKMIKQNMLANTMPAITPPVKVEPVKVEPIKPVVAAKAESKNKPLGMDFADDLLKEMQEDEKVEDDSSLDIMGDLKGKKIEADELEFDAMDVLSMIRTNVKSSKQAKGKNKPKTRP